MGGFFLWLTKSIPKIFRFELPQILPEDRNFDQIFPSHALDPETQAQS